MEFDYKKWLKTITTITFAAFIVFLNFTVIFIGNIVVLDKLLLNSHWFKSHPGHVQDTRCAVKTRLIRGYEDHHTTDLFFPILYNQMRGTYSATILLYVTLE